MSLRLVACPSCSNYVKASEPHCIVCGKKLRSDAGVVGRTAGAVLMGLSLSACPADDTSSETMAGTESVGSTGTGSASMSASASASATSTDPSTGTTEATDPSGSDSTTFAGESAYGVPGTGTTIETETSADTDTDTDTETSGTTAAETGSTSVSPDYGVPDTSP